MATSLRRSGRIQDQQQKIQPPHTSASNTEAMSVKQKPDKASKRRKTGEKPSIGVSGDARMPAESSENAIEGSQPTRPDKRVRGRRGLLKSMIEIPLDTLHEIFRELEPVDLLHLSWSSKSLNSIIMERSARYIWEEAFGRLYDSENPPPRCPDDLNLAQYAKFLFEKNCMLCGTVHGYYTSWMLRLRACWKCLSDSERFQSVGYGDRYSVLTISAKKQDFCLIDDWLECVKSMTTPSLCEARQKVRVLKKKDMDQFNDWETNRSQDRQEELHQLRLQRKAEILSKLAELGWPVPQIEELTRDSISRELPGFRKAKKLGNREWRELQPKLLERLEELQRIYLEEKKKGKLRERWLAFRDKFEKWNSTRTAEPYWKPRIIDIATLSPFRSTIFRSSLEDAVFDIVEIDRAAKTWMDSRNDFLISLLPQDVQASVVAVAGDGRPVLPHLACLLFKKPKGCYSSSVNSYTLSDVCEHRHYTRGGNTGSEDNELRNAIWSVSGYRPWDWDFQTFELEFDEKAHIIAKNVLRDVFGLNPLETTLTQMQECTLWFECTQCPRDSYCFGTRRNWLQIIDHEMRYEGDDSVPITTRWASKDILQPESREIDGA